MVVRAAGEWPPDWFGLGGAQVQVLLLPPPPPAARRLPPSLHAHLGILCHPCTILPPSNGVWVIKLQPRMMMTLRPAWQP